MKKKVAILLIILMFMSVITGCWDRIEINDIAIATIAALDKGDNGNLQMTLMISIPKEIQSGGSSSGSSNKKNYILISGEGDTVMDAFEKIQKKTSRNLFLSHLKVLIIGEKLLRTQSTKTKAVVNEKGVEMNIQIKSDSIIFESSSKLDLSQHAAVHYIEKIESDYVKHLLDSSLKRIQLDYGTDILGFGKVVYNENSKLWREKYVKIWDDEFRKIKVNITPIIQIPRIGFDTKPATIPEKEFLKVED